MCKRLPGHAARDLLKVGFRQIAKPRLWADPAMTADDKDKERDAPSNESSRAPVPHELSIRPNYDLNAIEFEVVDQDRRGSVTAIYDQDMPDILLKSISAWARLRDRTNTP